MRIFHARWERAAAALLATALSSWSPARCPGAADAGPSGAGESLAALAEKAVTCNRAREGAIQSIRGCFASDYRRSQACMVGESGDEAKPFPPRHLSAGMFLLAGRRSKVDGVAIKGGHRDPWELCGPECPPARLLVGEGGKRVAPPRAPIPRTCIISDGQYCRVYDGANDSLTITQQDAVAAREIIGRLMFAQLFAPPVPEELAGMWRRRAAAVGEQAGTHWTAMGTERIEGVTCERLRVTEGWKTPGPVRKVEFTWWLAPARDYAPARVERLYWQGTDKALTSVRADVWQTESWGQRPTDAGVWLPERVRVEKCWVAAKGKVEWWATHITQFFGVQVNQPVTDTDFLMTGPPLNTMVSDNASAIPEEEARPPRDAYKTIQSWAAETEPLEQDAMLQARLLEISNQDFPAVPAPAEEGKPAQPAGGAR